MEYIGNLENCRIYQQEDGTICADLNCTSIKTHTERPKPSILPILDGMRLMVKMWIYLIVLVFFTFLLEVPTEELSTLGATGWITLFSIFSEILFGAKICLDFLSEKKNTFLRIVGGILGLIVAAILFYIDADMILLFNGKTLCFIPHYVAAIVGLGAVKCVIELLWERKHGECESPIQLRNYGWISFPKLTDLASQTDATTENTAG